MPSLVTWGPDSPFPIISLNSFDTAVWPAANRAIYVPIAVYEPALITAFWWVNGATAGNGNADLGLFDENGVKLISTGATLTVGANSRQSVNVTDTLIGPGTFYLGLSLASASDAIFRVAYSTAEVERAFGMAQQASAHPLPAVATFASIASAYVPMCGALVGPRTMV